MFTKAEIQSVDYIGNTCLVRIPLFENAASDAPVIVEAQMSCQPGVYGGYQKGDMVWVSFETNLPDKPIVLGKMYLGVKAEQKSDGGAVKASTLTVENSATLPAETTFTGIETYNSIKKIQDALLKTTNATGGIGTTGSKYLTKLDYGRFQNETMKSVVAYNCASKTGKWYKWWDDSQTETPTDADIYGLYVDEDKIQQAEATLKYNDFDNNYIVSPAQGSPYVEPINFIYFKDATAIDQIFSQYYALFINGNVNSTTMFYRGHINIGIGQIVFNTDREITGYTIKYLPKTFRCRIDNTFTVIANFDNGTKLQTKTGGTLKNFDKNLCNCIVIQYAEKTDRKDIYFNIFSLRKLLITSAYSIYIPTNTFYSAVSGSTIDTLVANLIATGVSLPIKFVSNKCEAVCWKDYTTRLKPSPESTEPAPDFETYTCGTYNYLNIGAVDTGMLTCYNNNGKRNIKLEAHGLKLFDFDIDEQSDKTNAENCWTAEENEDNYVYNLDNFKADIGVSEDDWADADATFANTLTCQSYDISKI